MFYGHKGILGTSLTILNNFLFSLPIRQLLTQLLEKQGGQIWAGGGVANL